MSKNKSQIGEIKPENSTSKLDLKNKKILSALMRNAKIPFSKLSKSVGLSKSNIIQRVKNLEKAGIITGYHAFIDANKLGINSCLLMLKTSFLEKEKEKYINSLKHVNEIYSIIKVTGAYEIVTAFYYKKQEQKDSIIEKIINNGKIRDYQIINIKTHFPVLDYTTEIFNSEGKPRLREKNSKDNADSLDIKILTKLSQNCRTSLIELSAELKTSREKIGYRIKKHVENEIIAKFQPTINLFILGYESYFLILKLKKQTSKKNIIDYLSSTLRCNTILETDSAWSIMCFIHFRNNVEFRTFEENLMEKFSNAIFEYNFELIKNQYKLDWFSKSAANHLV